LGSGNPSRREVVDQRLQALISDYDGERQGERQHQVAQGAIGSIAAALGIGLIALLGHACDVSAAKGCVPVPAWLYAILPLPFFSLAAVAVQIGTIQGVRFNYLKALERAIHKESEARVEIKGGEVWVPSFHHLIHPIVAKYPGWRAKSYQSLYLVVGLSPVVIGIAVLVYCIRHVHPIGLTVAVAAVYGSLAFVVGVPAALGFFNFKRHGLKPLLFKELKQGDAAERY